MTARIIDGLALSRAIRAELAERAAALTARGTRPGLAVILVGDSPASAVYVRNKIRACAEADIHSICEHLPADTTEAALLSRIRELNAEPSVHGILVQLPLPPQIDEARVIETISPAKDVDGFHLHNAGALLSGTPLFRPCTPLGVMKLIEHAGTRTEGADAVIVGRSNIGGKPLALMLTAANATVTICHSRTRDLAAHTRRADILVAAVGSARMITGDMIKPGATVIDVGINRIADGPDAGKLCGDIDFDSASQVAGAITPVPGGVGPMTIAMLLANTVDSARRFAG